MHDPFTDRFKIRNLVGKGSFGEVYEAEDSQSKKIVALKLERLNVNPSQLLAEAKIYDVVCGEVGFSDRYSFNSYRNFNMLAIDLLGPNIQDLYKRCGNTFSLKTVLMITDQAIARIEYLHTKNYIHCDIKPENLCIGSGKSSNVIFLVDFGLSTRYRDPETHEHIPPRGTDRHVGNERYLSINAHLNNEQSRKDDLESLGYVLVFLIKGSLPWMGFKATSGKQLDDMIASSKMTTSIDKLCADIPQEFGDYLRDVRSLRFDEEPHYVEYRRRFMELFLRQGFIFDDKYDWTGLLSTNAEDQADLSSAHRRTLSDADHLNRSAVPLCPKQNLTGKPNPFLSPSIRRSNAIIPRTKVAKRAILKPRVITNPF